jgi:hypothetical protein
MIRLELSDFQEPERSRLASKTKLSPEAFEKRFRSSVQATTPSP